MLVDERPIESHCCTPAAAHARTPAGGCGVSARKRRLPLQNSPRARTILKSQKLILDFSFAARTRLLGWLQENVPQSWAWRRRNRVSGFGKSWGVLCLSSSTTLKAGSVAPQDDSPIGSRRRKVPADARGNMRHGSPQAAECSRTRTRASSLQNAIRTLL